MRNILFSVFAISLFIVVSCRKDKDVTDISIDIPEAKEIAFLDFSGIIVDDNANGILEAKVEIIQDQVVAAEVYSNADGSFQVESTFEGSRALFMRVTKSGFVTATNRMDETNTQNDEETIVLMPESIAPQRGTPISPDSNLIVLVGKVIDETGAPITERMIMIQTPDQQVSYGYTGNTGDFRVTTQPDVPLTLMIISRLCRATELNTEIGPFSADTNLPPLVVEPFNNDTYSLRGQLTDCEGNSMTDGTIQFEFNGITLFTKSNEQGEYSLLAPDCIINESTQVVITAFDSSYSNASTPIDLALDQEEIVVQTLEVCTTGASDIEVSLEGQSYTSSLPHNYLNRTPEGVTEIYPINSREGLTLFFSGGTTGTFEATQVSFTQGDLTVIGGSRVGRDTNCEVTITTFEENLIEGSFTGSLIKNNTRELLPVSGKFRIEQ